MPTTKMVDTLGQYDHWYIPSAYPSPGAYRTFLLCTLDLWCQGHSRPNSIVELSRDGILGQQFDKRLLSFAPCYSQSLLLVWKSMRKMFETRNLESIHVKHFLEPKNGGEENRQNSSLRRLEFVIRNLHLKLPPKKSISGQVVRIFTSHPYLFLVALVSMKTSVIVWLARRVNSSTVTHREVYESTRPFLPCVT